MELKLIFAILTGILLSNLSIFSAPFYIGALIDGLGLNAIQAGLVNTFEIGAVAGERTESATPGSNVGVVAMCPHVGVPASASQIVDANQFQV